MAQMGTSLWAASPESRPRHQPRSPPRTSRARLRHPKLRSLGAGRPAGGPCRALGPEAAPSRARRGVPGPTRSAGSSSLTCSRASAGRIPGLARPGHRGRRTVHPNTDGPSTPLGRTPAPRSTRTPRIPAPLGDPPAPRRDPPPADPPPGDPLGAARGPAHGPWKTTGPRMQRGRETGARARGGAGPAGSCSPGRRARAKEPVPESLRLTTHFSPRTALRCRGRPGTVRSSAEAAASPWPPASSDWSG